MNDNPTARLSNNRLEYLSFQLAESADDSAQDIRRALIELVELRETVKDHAWQIEQLETAAKQWMADYYRLKDKYEPMELVES